VEVRRNAYLTMVQTADSYLVTVQQIPQVSDKSAYADKLQDARIKAANAADALKILGNDKTYGLSFQLLHILNGVSVENSKEDIDKAVQQAGGIWNQFAEAARQDLETIR
jgi:hypothetical protein